MFLRLFCIDPTKQRIGEFRFDYPSKPLVIGALRKITGHKTLKFVWITHQTMVAFSDEESEEASFFLPGSPRLYGRAFIVDCVDGEFCSTSLPASELARMVRWGAGLKDHKALKETRGPGRSFSGRMQAARSTAGADLMAGGR